MKFSAILLAVAAAASAQSFDSSQASLSLFYALPTSIQALALTNPGGAATAIAAQFATGTPTWFLALPTPVQTYFLNQAAGSSSAVTTTSSASSSRSSSSSTSTDYLTSISSTQTAGPGGSQPSDEAVITPTQTATSSTGSSSRAAVIAPAVVVSIAAIIIGICVILWYRQRRRASAKMTVASPGPGMTENPSELPGNLAAAPPNELDGKERYHSISELEANQHQPVELAAPQRIDVRYP